LEIIKAMTEIGNPNSVTDAGVGALCARAAVLGAHLNVKINATGYDDKERINALLQDAKRIENETLNIEAQILKMVEEKI
jgi:glutamate formiminotransferase / formiminotetrahydrofolate cyclodeaminase